MDRFRVRYQRWGFDNCGAPELQRGELVVPATSPEEAERLARRQLEAEADVAVQRVQAERIEAPAGR